MWLQQRLVFLEIVDLPDPQNRYARIAGRDAIHQTAANAAEVVGHGVAADDGVALGELGGLIFTSNVLERLVFDDEVRGEHRERDLAVVGAVADEL